MSPNNIPRHPNLAALRQLVDQGDACALAAADPDRFSHEERRQCLGGWADALEALRDSGLRDLIAYPHNDVRKARLAVANLRGAAVALVQTINRAGGIGHADPALADQIRKSLHALVQAVQDSLEVRA